MELRGKRGLNQRGICYVNSIHSKLSKEACTIIRGTKDCLADIRINDAVSVEDIVLDHRVFDRLGMSEDDSVSVESAGLSVPYATEVSLSVNSTQGLDNVKVAEAISKRAQDLEEDFDGLVVRSGDSIHVGRLGLSFEVTDLEPSSPSRITWSRLRNIRLIPVAEPGPMNLVCVVEVGAASHIEDVRGDEGVQHPRYEMYLRMLDGLGEMQSIYSKGGLFAGLVYSADVDVFETFNSDTGQRSDTAQLESRSVVDSYKRWVQDVLPENRHSPSNLGDAISDCIEVADRIRNMSGFPTGVVVLSSGIFTVGPNPVKKVSRAEGSKDLRLFFFYSGDGVDIDILQAMADKASGVVKKIDTQKNIENALASISLWLSKQVRNE